MIARSLVVSHGATGGRKLFSMKLVVRGGAIRSTGGLAGTPAVTAGTPNNRETVAVAGSSDRWLGGLGLSAKLLFAELVVNSNLAAGTKERSGGARACAGGRLVAVVAVVVRALRAGVRCRTPVLRKLTRRSSRSRHDGKEPSRRLGGADLLGPLALGTGGHQQLDGQLRIDRAGS
jgi:hypothetical protein